MNTELEPLRTLQLRGGQTFLLQPPFNTHKIVYFSCLSGYARFSGSFGEPFSDVTLGFCGGLDSSCINLPPDTNLLLEALIDLSIEFTYLSDTKNQSDLLWQWLLDLHLVRHPVGAESRLNALFQLLVSRFGTKTLEGYSLPFGLGHSRIAELIGTTRSTVTRLITNLRHQHDLYLCESPCGFKLSERLIESPL